MENREPKETIFVTPEKGFKTPVRTPGTPKLNRHVERPHNNDHVSRALDFDAFEEDEEEQHVDASFD